MLQPESNQTNAFNSRLKKTKYCEDRPKKTVMSAFIVFIFNMYRRVLCPQYRWKRHYIFGSSVRPSVVSNNSYFALRDVSILSEGISMKLGTNIHHVSE